MLFKLTNISNLPMIFSKKNITNVLMTSCFIILSGCANQPRKIIPSLPLVAEYSNAMPTKEVVPTHYWNALNNANVSQLKHPKYKILVGQPYISALGDKCRELDIADSHHLMQKRVVCELHFNRDNGKKDKAWFLEPELSASTRPIEL